MPENKKLRDRMLVQGSAALQRTITDEQTEFMARDVHLRPIVYVDGWNTDLCAACAEARLVEAEQFEDLSQYVCWKEDQIQDAYIHHEGGDVICGDCNTRIASMYGDPFEDED